MKTLVTCALVLCLSSPAWALPVEVEYTVSGQSGDWTLDFSLRNNTNPSIDAPVDFTLYRFGVSLPESSIAGSPIAWAQDVPLSLNTVVYGHAWTFDETPWYTPNPPPGPAVILFPQTTLDGFLLHSTEQEAPLSASWISFGSAMPGNGRYGPWSGGKYAGSPTRIALFTGTSTAESATETRASVPEPGTWLLVLGGLVAMLIAARPLARVA
jgi:hypothetical protein